MTFSSDQGDLELQRARIVSLLAPADPADARAAYYALEYDDRRVRLTLHTLANGQVDGFCAVCQTGRDLFVPLVILRASRGTVGDLLRSALLVGRPYDIVTVPTLSVEVTRVMSLVEQHTNRVFVFEPSAYRPLLNVMVQPGEGPFRYEIWSGDQVVAAAGVSWRSARKAEMYVYSKPDVQSRGWDRAVGSACIRALLDKGLLPLYTVVGDEPATSRLPLLLGFRDRGAAEFEGRGQLRTDGR